MAYFTETSVRYAIFRPLRGTTQGNIRTFDHGNADLRHGFRKHPQIRPHKDPLAAYLKEVSENMPQNMLTAASFTEASEETTTQTPFHGTSHGSIRKISHF